MNTGAWIFVAGAVLGAAGTAVSGWHTAAAAGRAAAAKETAVTGTSLAAYVAASAALGYGFPAQILGTALGAAVLYAGRRWVPAVDVILHLMRGQR